MNDQVVEALDLLQLRRIEEERFLRWAAIAREEADRRGFELRPFSYAPDWVNDALWGAGDDPAREREILVSWIDPSARETHPSACENFDVSAIPALVRTSDGDKLSSSSRQPSACENSKFSQRMDREIREPEEGSSSLIRACENRDREKVGRLSAFETRPRVRPRGDRSPPDLVLEERLWTASVMANPFATRKAMLPKFMETFDRSRATFDRRLSELRAGWRAPFRRAG